LQHTALPAFGHYFSYFIVSEPEESALSA
jgi:hypothetical protein